MGKSKFKKLPTTSRANPSSVRVISDRAEAQDMPTIHEEPVIAPAHQVFDKMSELSVGRKAIPSDSHTLGEDDFYNDEETSSSVGEDSATQHAKVIPQVKKGDASTSLVNFLKDTRKPFQGLTLHYFPTSEDVVQLEWEDITPVEEIWGFCLISYVAGHFPSKQVILKTCQKWGVEYTYFVHESGWLVFKFNDEESRNKVLSEGPYYIFEKPLLLKVIPPFFNFRKEESMNKDPSKFAVDVVAAPATKSCAAPAAASKVEEKKEEADESDDDMGFSLFD